MGLKHPIVAPMCLAATLLSFTVHAQPPTKYALLIGIDDYKSNTISDLRGCANDVELMSTILAGKFEFPPENIHVLKNQQATRQGIIDAIQNQLIAQAQADDVVIIHYSGHGSQMPDTSGDEIDQLDETIVPHDSRTMVTDSNGQERRIFDISDDEINGLLQQLTEKTQKVTFILDSCHSGSGLRGGATVREVPADTVRPPPPADFAISVRGAEGDAGIRLRGADYVLISGCLSTELSNETQLGNQRHGVLSYYLAQALKEAGDDTTYQDVMDKVSHDVSNRFATQHPQLEGPGADLVVFGTDRISAEPYLLVQPKAGNRATVNAGKVQGLTDGSILTVYPPRTRNFAQADSIATIEITASKDFTAEATITEGGPIPEHARAVIDTLQHHANPIAVHIASQADLNDAAITQLTQIREQLSQAKTLSLIDDETSARLLVRHDDQWLRVHSGDNVVLVPPVNASDADAVEHVVKQVNDLVHWFTVLDLENPNPNMTIDFTLRRKDDPEGAVPPTEVEPDAKITYQVTNPEGNPPLYITVLDVSSDGSITVLYPPTGEQQPLSPGGKPLVEEIEMFLPEGHSTVVDVLKVFATIEPIKNSQSVFSRDVFRSGSDDPLSQFLADAVRGERGARPIQVKSWVTEEKTIRVRQPGTRLAGFAIHHAQGTQALRALTRSAEDQQNQDLCIDQSGSGNRECFQLKNDKHDSTISRASLPATRSGDKDKPFSVGQAFDEAYRIQDQSGATRVEPLLDVQMPGLETDRGVSTRGLGDSDSHADEARDDDHWNHKQIRVADAWQKLRTRHNVPEGAEADGVLIAHPDTGFRMHPEIWHEGVNGKRPIDPSKGFDYYDGDDNSEDPLLDNDWRLDNPAHGTTSGSVIVSPPGCQLAGDHGGCVDGIGRGAQLAPLRVHRTVSQFNTDRLAQAIREVADSDDPNKPRLISIAMGGPPSWTLWKAVKAAEAAGVLVVAASGNYIRTVVWPARFESTIAVAATDVHCKPWKHSSRGGTVDIAAPGESVWRAWVDENGTDVVAMSKGTTLATGNTSGAAALWLAYHRDDPKLATLQQQGLVTAAFRNALKTSSWRPSNDASNNPSGTHCDEDTPWDEDYGPGILDVASLLDVPLQAPVAAAQPDTRAVSQELTEDELPFFRSLYPEGTPTETIRRDYLSIVNYSLDRADRFETEILHHYTINDEVRQAIDALVSNQGQEDSEQLAEHVQQALLKKDLSSRLRETLN